MPAVRNKKGCGSVTRRSVSRSQPKKAWHSSQTNSNFKGAAKSVGHLAPASANSQRHVYERPTHHAQIPVH
jgi:hypothetical protein